MGALLLVAAATLAGVAAAEPLVELDPEEDLSGEGTTGEPYEISDASELQAMRGDLDASYVLVADIDATGTAAWNEGAGFEPVGDEDDPFTGSLDGNGHVIDGLTIARDENDVGLFGATEDAEITAVSLLNADVTGSVRVGALVGSHGSGVVSGATVDGVVTGEGGESVGGLVGYGAGEVTDSHATVDVRGTGADGTDAVGGLVGHLDDASEGTADGSVTDSSAAGTVTATGDDVGGLVGWVDRADVTGSEATGAVDGNARVGGLIGRSAGDAEGDVVLIDGSSAAGDVTGESDEVGGLVGSQSDTEVRASSATGDVVGGDDVGGLVGLSDVGSLVVDSVAAGDVDGGSGLGIGGLVGHSLSADVTGSTAGGDVTGGGDLGGLVGVVADGTVTDSRAVGNVTGADDGERDDVGGLVGHLDDGTVSGSYATGTVTSEATGVGGLVGTVDDGTIDDSYATGTLVVDAAERVGGLVGQNRAGEGATSAVRDSYARVAIVGDADTVGGVVGVNDGGTVETTYWDVTATADLGDEDGVGEEIGDGDGVETIALDARAFAGFNATVELGGLDFGGPWLPGETAPDLAWDSPYADGSDAFDGLVDGDGTDTEPYRIGTVYELQAISGQRTATHTLTNDVDASATADWASSGGVGFGSIGFEPIGSDIEPFEGSFDGDGHVIDGLTIDRDEDGVGLFGVVGTDGTVSGVEVVNADVSGVNQLGALVGNNRGEVTGSHANAEIIGKESSIPEGSTRAIGGLVGQNDGSVVGSSASGTLTVEDGDGVGGLVGRSFGLVDGSNASVAVSAADGSSVGGLLGSNDGTVIDSRATGTVTAANGMSVGGLVGSSTGTQGEDDVIRSVATGDVLASGGENVGGLVGNAGSWAEVIDSSATGTVVGERRVGGLVGNTESDVYRSFATGNVEAGETSGGLVGRSYGPIVDSYATGDVTDVSGFGGLGGLVGEIQGSASTSYATGEISGEGNGGFAGTVADVEAVTDAYWDVETSGTTFAVGEAGGPGDPDDVDGITGLDTAEMQGAASVENMALAFNPIWIATDDYPRLVRQVDGYALAVDETELDVGETATSTVTLALADGTTLTATEPANYTVDDGEVASVDDGGTVTATDDGAFELVAAASGFEDAVSLSVIAPSTGSTSSGSSSSTPTPSPTPTPTPTPTPSPTPTETAPDPEPEPTPTAEPEPEATEEPDEASAVPATTGGRSVSFSQAAVGGSAAAIGGWAGLVLFSRTELFASAAPASVASAIAAVPGTTSYVLAEPEQAAFVVAGATVRPSGGGDARDGGGDARDGGGDARDGSGDDRATVAAGGAVTVEATIENKGDVSGAREVTLTLEDAEDVTTLDLDAHSAETVALEYETTRDDAGKTLGFTVDCETDATDVDVEVTDATANDTTTHEPMNETTTGDRASIDGETTGEAGGTDETAGIGETGGTDDDIDEGTRTGALDRLWLAKGKVLGYVAGSIIIYIGVTNFANNRFAGGLGVFLGVMALPIVRAQLPTSTRVLISRYGKVLVVILAAVFSGALFDTTAVVETARTLLP